VERTGLAGITAAALLGAGVAGGLGGCEGMGRALGSGDDAPSMDVRASTRSLVAGEIATFTLSTRDTYGRDVRAVWESSGGDLTTDEGGRVARVRFAEPGEYLVTAKLFEGEREVDQETVNVRVRPVP
jgi:hypothetical protein